jgi:hypothetical protein
MSKMGEKSPILDVILEKISSLCCNRYSIGFLILILLVPLAFCIWRGFYGYATFVAFIIVGLLIYNSINRTTENSKRSVAFAQTNPLAYYELLIVFFVCFGASIAYLRFFAPLYVKPLPYYLLIGVCALSIFPLCLSTEKKLSESAAPLLIVLLGFNLILSNLIVFPHGITSSSDAYFHVSNLVMPIINTGHLLANVGSSFFPAHELYVASLSIFSGIEPMMLYLAIIGILFPLSSIFIFLITKRLVGARYGAMSMFFYLIAPEVVNAEFHAYQFSYAVVFALFVLFCVFFLLSPYVNRRGSSLYYSGPSVIICLCLGYIALVWAHQWTSLVTLIFIILFFVLFRLFDARLKLRYGLLLLFPMVLLFHWLYTSTVVQSIQQQLSIYSTTLLSSENYQAAASVSLLLTPINIVLSLLNNVGEGILLMLAVIGSFYGLQRKNSTVAVLVVVGIGTFFIISLGTFLKIPLFLGARLLAFFWIVSAVYLAAIGIVLLANLQQKKWVYFSYFVILLIPAFAIGSSISGNETALFATDQPAIKFFETASDIQAKTWMQENLPPNFNVTVGERYTSAYSDSNHSYSSPQLEPSGRLDINITSNNALVIKDRYFTEGVRAYPLGQQQGVSEVVSGNTTAVSASSSFEKVVKLNSSGLDQINEAHLQRIYSNTGAYILIK